MGKSIEEIIKEKIEELKIKKEKAEEEQKNLAKTRNEINTLIEEIKELAEEL